MRILVAPDSFKECLAASEVADYIALGIHRVFPAAEIIKLPLSDGGEGLTKTLTAAAGGELFTQTVTGPLGNKVKAFYAILPDKIAVIEMAQASGLALIPHSQRNPMDATTYGTGELIKVLLDKGCRQIIIGVGGSATNDGGAGMAQALGVRLLDRNGKDIVPGARGLLELDDINMEAIDPRLADTEILAACDVTNPLYGPEGAAYVYAQQKGAAANSLPILDDALQRLALIVAQKLDLNIANIPGAGAAGGLGAGLMAFAGAKLQPGLELVMSILNIDAVLADNIKLVITGEGEINGQTLYGKVPIGVASRAKKYNLPVLAIVGRIGVESEKVYAGGIDAVMSISPGPISLKESISRAGELLADAASRAMRMILLGKNHFN